MCRLLLLDWRSWRGISYRLQLLASFCFSPSSLLSFIFTSSLSSLLFLPVIIAFAMSSVCQIHQQLLLHFLQISYKFHLTLPILNISVLVYFVLFNTIPLFTGSVRYIFSDIPYNQMLPPVSSSTASAVS